jgi:hypothetical protein
MAAELFTPTTVPAACKPACWDPADDSASRVDDHRKQRWALILSKKSNINKEIRGIVKKIRARSL